MVAASVAVPAAFGQGTTAFVYQGQLNVNGAPASGVYDVRFGLYTASTVGSQVGGFITNLAASLSNGMFTATLDFGAGVFTGAGRWMEIAVRTNGNGVFAVLTPRQQLTPVPYALMSAGASNLLGTLPATQISGAVLNGQIANSFITVSAGTGLSGGGAVPLGGAVALNNAGVLSLTGNADITATTINGLVTLGDTGTSGNTANTLMKRDASGSFGAASAYLANNLYLPAPEAGAGLIYSGSTPFLYVGGNNSANFCAGIGAGNLTMSGSYNTAAGSMSLVADTTGANNTAYGYGALGNDSSGGENTAGGVNALLENQMGNQNAAFGAAAMFRNTSGSANAAMGYEALFNNTTGSNNTATGYQALYGSTTATANIAVGYRAGINITTGSSNIDIGNAGLATDTNVIRIGNGQGQAFFAGTINGDAGGLTNLNPAGFSGLIPSGSIDDGGNAAYQQFLEPANSFGGTNALPLSELTLVASNSGPAPSFAFLLDGTAFGSASGFVGREAISDTYEFDVEVIAPSASLVPDAQLGHQGALTFSRNGRVTTFAGTITGCSLSSYDGTNSRYTFRLEPPLAYLALNSDYRIFQSQTVPMVASNLYATITGGTVSEQTTGSYTVLDSLTQFGETDLNFFNRILEDEGIFYYFAAGGAAPTLTMGDSAAAFYSAPSSPLNYYGDLATNAPAGVEFVRVFQMANRESVKTSTIRAYNFLLGSPILIGSYTAPEGQGELYTFGSSATTGAAISAQAKLRGAYQLVERDTIFGAGNAPDLRPGATFSLNDESGAGLSGTYVVTAVRHSAFRRITNGVVNLYYGNEFQVIPTSVRYVPALKTPKPLTHPCSAVVTGASGEEIYTDGYGRIKVQFHWDRVGQNNEKSSAWIRVTTPWSGKNWGMIFIPRVGQEVLVDFVNGDPDEPVVVGSLYNADNMPPYTLPANQTQSGIKTRSSKGGTPTDFNEIRFEDKLGSEALNITAQKDFGLVAGNNATMTAGNTLTISAAGGIGINATPNSAFALNIGGSINAGAFQGDGSGLSLAADVARVDSNETFTAQQNFAAPVAISGALTLTSPFQIFTDGYLNDHDIHLRNDNFHGLGWYGITKTFAGISPDGPVLYGYTGGGLGYRNSSSTNIVLAWNSSGNVGIGTNTPAAMLDVVGDTRVHGLLRSGTETGTTEAPDPAGMVVRRVNSTSVVSNSVVAASGGENGGGAITLVRDGTAAGFQIQYPARPGYLTIACMGLDGTGAPRNFYTTIANPSSAGTVQVFANSNGVVHFECTFGITYDSGQHLTQVTLSRYGSDYFWSGTLASTYDQ